MGGNYRNGVLHMTFAKPVSLIALSCSTHAHDPGVALWTGLRRHRLWKAIRASVVSLGAAAMLVADT